MKELPLNYSRDMLRYEHQVLKSNLYLIQLKERDLRADGIQHCGGYRLGGNLRYLFLYFMVHSVKVFVPFSCPSGITVTA